VRLQLATSASPLFAALQYISSTLTLVAILVLQRVAFHAWADGTALRDCTLIAHLFRDVHTALSLRKRIRQGPLPLFACRAIWQGSASAAAGACSCNNAPLEKFGENAMSHGEEEKHSRGIFPVLIMSTRAAAFSNLSSQILKALQLDARRRMLQ
jgi:hypothetical protein